MKMDALISPCGTYRYWLSRVWDESRPCGAWIMLNPSTADATTDDPTIRRIVGFSRAWGWGGAKVYNLFAMRSPAPSELRKHANPIGPDNDRHLMSVQLVQGIVAAWGQHGGYLARAQSVCDMLENSHIDLCCLGVNRDGTPKHPLYVPASVTATPFRRAKDSCR